MTSSISFDSTLSIPKDVLRQELDGESVILDINSGSYFGLNTVGSFMWNALVESASIDEAFQTIKNEYDAEEAQLKSDLEELISKLLDHGLLELK